MNINSMGINYDARFCRFYKAAWIDLFTCQTTPCNLKLFVTLKHINLRIKWLVPVIDAWILKWREAQSTICNL